MVVDISKLSPYEGPLPSSLFPQITLVLLGLGLMFSSWFFVFEVTSTNKTRNLVKEITQAGAAAFFLGFGTIFLFLWVGIYV